MKTVYIFEPPASGPVAQKSSKLIYMQPDAAHVAKQEPIRTRAGILNEISAL
jgi:hypothetical protein